MMPMCRPPLTLTCFLYILLPLAGGRCGKSHLIRCGLNRLWEFAGGTATFHPPPPSSHPPHSFSFMSSEATARAARNKARAMAILREKRRAKAAEQALSPSKLPKPLPVAGPPKNSSLDLFVDFSSDAAAASLAAAGARGSGGEGFQPGATVGGAGKPSVGGGC